MSASKLYLFVQRGKDNVSQEKQQLRRQWVPKDENAVLGLSPGPIPCSATNTVYCDLEQDISGNVHSFWCQWLLLKSKILILKILLLSNCRAILIFLGPVNYLSAVLKALLSLLFFVLKADLRCVECWNNLWGRWWAGVWFCSLMVVVLNWGCKETLILVSIVMGLVFTGTRTASIENWGSCSFSPIGFHGLKVGRVMWDMRKKKEI